MVASGTQGHNLPAITPDPTIPASEATQNIGALIIRIGCWGPLYYNYDKEPPK